MTPLLVAALLACTPGSNAAPPGGTPAGSASSAHDDSPAPVPVPAKGQAVAVLAGGCFWCLESDFDHLDGIVATTSGYIGGSVDKPTYYQVGTGGTGHTEAVHVVYDASKLTYDQVLDYFWRHIDPTDSEGQFCDRGNQYRPGIYPIDAAQLAAAEKSRAALEASHALPAPVAVEIKAGATFWPAEVYHQDYWKKEPQGYQRYRTGCGRDARVQKLWSK